MAIFWPFLRKGVYRINLEMQNLARSIPRHKDSDSGKINLKDHVWTMFWPYKGHVLAIYRKGGYRIDPAM